MKSNLKFNDLKGVGCLAAKLVETKKHLDYTLVYRLIKLVLVLPVSTASVERAFSAMKIVKTRLRSKMKNGWLNDCLVTYIEKDVFEITYSEDAKLLTKTQSIGLGSCPWSDMCAGSERKDQRSLNTLSWLGALQSTAYLLGQIGSNPTQWVIIPVVNYDSYRKAVT
ncbi:zinc finger MYM-type protein 1-like protein [Tanacetum coccineum]